VTIAGSRSRLATSHWGREAAVPRELARFLSWDEMVGPHMRQVEHQADLNATLKMLIRRVDGFR
jgi:hypothetical protein